MSKCQTLMQCWAVATRRGEDRETGIRGLTMGILRDDRERRLQACLCGSAIANAIRSGQTTSDATAKTRHRSVLATAISGRSAMPIERSAAILR